MGAGAGMAESIHHGCGATDHSEDAYEGDLIDDQPEEGACVAEPEMAGSNPPGTLSGSDSEAGGAIYTTSGTQCEAPSTKSKAEATRSAKEREFWQGLAKVVDGNAYSVWLAVEKQMQQFHAVLRARAAAVARNEGLKAQQLQLQSLLEQQMAAPINAELQLPTTTLLAAAATALKSR